jgi:hypothetical protein
MKKVDVGFITAENYYGARGMFRAMFLKLHSPADKADFVQNCATAVQ